MIETQQSNLVLNKESSVEKSWVRLIRCRSLESFPDRILKMREPLLIHLCFNNMYNAYLNLDGDTANSSYKPLLIHLCFKMNFGKFLGAYILIFKSSSFSTALFQKETCVLVKLYKWRPNCYITQTLTRI